MLAAGPLRSRSVAPGGWVRACRRAHRPSFSAAAFGFRRPLSPGAFRRPGGSGRRGGSSSGLVVFPAPPCRARLLPAPSVSACFCGLGSGS
ncbi:MAG: hypothetical protein IPL59_17385 [Candidatus Competibacteraceae bacterium]|nr:hypothetical protein [Candidatus Competibacteraceae bacterium]